MNSSNSSHDSDMAPTALCSFLVCGLAALTHQAEKGGPVPTSGLSVFLGVHSTHEHFSLLF